MLNIYMAEESDDIVAYHSGSYFFNQLEPEKNLMLCVLLEIRLPKYSKNKAYCVWK